MEDSRYTVWKFRAAFLLIGMALIMLRLLPLQTVPRTWAGPDVMLCLVFAWSIRRPDYVPTFLIACVILLEDFLLQRPPGLHAALVVGFSFWLKAKAHGAEDHSWNVEITYITIATLGIFLATRLIYSIALLPLPALSLHFVQALSTLLFYPIMALTSAVVLNITPIKQREP